MTYGNAKFFNIIAGNEIIGRYEPVIDTLRLSNLSLNRTYSANNIIAEKNVVVPEGYEIGFDLEQDRKNFTVTESGIVVIEKNAVLPK